MFSIFIRLSFLSAITFVSFSYALPNPDRLARTRSLSKRAWPVFDWDFEAKDANDQFQALITALPEALLIVGLVHSKAVPTQWDNIYPHYFRPEEKQSVEKLFKDMIGATDDQSTGDGTGSNLFAGITITNKPDDKYDPCDGDDTEWVAWTANSDDGSAIAKMRLCPPAFKYPLLDTIHCDQLGDNVSGRMSGLAGVVLHELTHFDAIGRPAAGDAIVDHGDAGYGPMNTRSFKDNESNVPKINADNYRWFAQKVYWSAACKKHFGAPTENRDQIVCVNPDNGEDVICQL